MNHLHLQLTTIAIASIYFVGMMLTGKFIVETLIQTPSFEDDRPEEFETWYAFYKEVVFQQMMIMLVWPITVVVWIYRLDIDFRACFPWLTSVIRYINYLIYWLFAPFVYLGIAGYGVVIVLVTFVLTKTLKS